MLNRLFKQIHLEKMPENKLGDDRKKELINPGIFRCLNGNDVITSRVSDHHPIIHDGALFWNIMMQGKMRRGREGASYNNGFGFIENDKQYMNRLMKVSHVIAEIVYRNSSIETIGLCEGPIQSLHLNILIQSLKKFPWMERFLPCDIYHKPNVKGYQNWGLLMLSDKNNRVSEVKCDFIERSSVFDKIANRLQLWKIAKNGKDKYFALGHFPFSGDECVEEKTNLSRSGNIYCELINNLMNRYANDDFIFCADFNFNPYLINQWQDRVLDQITNNNSILLTTEEKRTIKTVTVDGVLLSQREKQKYYISRPNLGLFERLTHEYRLFKSYMDEYLDENRHKDSRLQNEYDKRFGLTLC
ncbi:MAG: hypothetical protein ABI597_10685 [Gammaproteobacteria bacterium]